MTTHTSTSEKAQSSQTIDFPHFIATFNHEGKDLDLYWATTLELTGKTEARYSGIIEALLDQGYIPCPNDFKLPFNEKLPVMWEGRYDGTSCYATLILESFENNTYKVSHVNRSMWMLSSSDFEHSMTNVRPKWQPTKWDQNVWVFVKPRK